MFFFTVQSDKSIVTIKENVDTGVERAVRFGGSNDPFSQATILTIFFIFCYLDGTLVSAFIKPNFTLKATAILTHRAYK